MTTRESTLGNPEMSPQVRTSLAAVCTELSGEGGMTLQEWPVAPLGPKRSAQPAKSSPVSPSTIG